MSDCMSEVFSQGAGLVCVKTIEIQKLKQQLADAEKVIDFYADEETYIQKHIGLNEYRVEIDRDCGDKAREYKSKHKVGE